MNPDTGGDFAFDGDGHGLGADGLEGVDGCHSSMILSGNTAVL